MRYGTAELRKTYKEKLRPTPAQERALEEVLWRCRDLYNAALEQRITAWQRRRVSVSRYEQEAELKDIRAEFPEYAAIHSPRPARRAGAAGQDLSGVLPSRPARREGGLPALQGAQSLPLLHLQGVRQRRAAGQWLAGAVARSGASACTGPARSRARPRPSRSRKRRMAGMWRSPAPTCRRIRCRQPGRRRASTGPEVFRTRRTARHRQTPATTARPSGIWRSAQRRVARRKKGSHRRRKAVGCAGQSASACAPAAAATSTTRRRSPWCAQYDTIYVEAIQAANLSRRPGRRRMATAAMSTTEPAARQVSTRVFTTPDGARSSPSSLSRLQAPGSEWKRSTRRTPRRSVPAACGMGRSCGERVAQVALDPYPRLYRGAGYVLDRDENAARNIQWRRAAPSGTRGDACGDEPRTRRALARAECQM